MASRKPHPDYYANFPAHCCVALFDCSDSGQDRDPEVAVARGQDCDVLAVAAGGGQDRDRDGLAVAGSQERNVAVAGGQDRDDAEVAVDALASGHDGNARADPDRGLEDFDQSDRIATGARRKSCRVRDRPNRSQYTHTCICKTKQASSEAKQVSWWYYNVVDIFIMYY